MKYKLLSFVLLLPCFSLLDFTGKSRVENDLICNKSTIIFAVDSLRENYSVDKGEPVGYQLELLNLYFTSKNINYEIIPVGDDNERLKMLQLGVIDIAVYRKNDSIPSPFDRNEIRHTLPMDDNFQSIWVVKNDNGNLVNNINLWMGKFKTTPHYRQLQAKYFDHTYRGRKGLLSPYDHWFKKYSTEIGWDWRLLAALSYQESKFNPEVESRKGAYGLMQVMPETAAYVGIDSIEHPEYNIRAGVKLIKWMTRQFNKEDSISQDEQLKFILSAYNAGFGRIEDCRNFARSQGKNANIWDEVKQVIPLMVEPEHYNGDYIQRGKFKGEETVRFVDEILERYRHYKNLVP